MIFDEEPRTILLLFGIGHVTFRRADRGKFQHPLAERQIFQARLILSAGLGFAVSDQRVQRVFTENTANRMEKLDRQIGMCIGEAPVAGLGQVPELRRTPDTLRHGMGSDQTFLSQSHQLLADSFAGRSQMFADRSCRLGASHLKREHNALGGRTCYRSVGI